VSASIDEEEELYGSVKQSLLGFEPGSFDLIVVDLKDRFSERPLLSRWTCRQLSKFLNRGGVLSVGSMLPASSKWTGGIDELADDPKCFEYRLPFTFYSEVRSGHVKMELFADWDMYSAVQRQEKPMSSSSSALAIIVDFVARRAFAIVVDSVARRAVAIIVDFVARQSPSPSSSSSHPVVRRAVTIVVNIVARRAIAIIVNFVDRRPVAIVVVDRCALAIIIVVARRAVAIIVEVVARRAVIIVVDVVIRCAVAIIIDFVARQHHSP
jgi:hypothetical protein